MLLIGLFQALSRNKKNKKEKHNKSNKKNIYLSHACCVLLITVKLLQKQIILTTVMTGLLEIRRLLTDASGAVFQNKRNKIAQQLT